MYLYQRGSIRQRPGHARPPPFQRSTGMDPAIAKGCIMTRYGVYFLPAADSALWRFGCASIGYDSIVGASTPFHEHDFFRSDSIRVWTSDPRRYGFHATLKPPFELLAGHSPERLDAIAAAFADGQCAFTVDRLVVQPISGFLALVPTSQKTELTTLANACVRTFEHIRGPLKASDRERRLKAPLSDRQLAYLDRWGYPYVFDEFRFHMTLTGRLPDDVVRTATSAFSELYKAADHPVKIDSICICEQPNREGQFRLRRRYPFRG
ncbi:MAG: DUF1045 domain-containing protein [Hyphomicrobiaceae bacterium]